MIYFDHNASSPPQKKHYKRVIERLEKVDANPSSIHQMGRRSKLVLEDSREMIASVLGAQAKNVIFTSGASEANNLALYYLKKKSVDEKELIEVAYTKLDHPSLSKALDPKLFNINALPLSSEGLILEDEIKIILKEKKIDFVSLTYVNGELGVINPVISLAEIIKSLTPDCHIHVDAVQALGKIDLRDLHGSKIDSASFAAHKIGGLKGIGCLYVKESLKAKLVPMIEGGSQEFGLRSGTENLMGVISFAEIVKTIDVDQYNEKLSSLRECLLSFVGDVSNQIIVNGNPKKSVANTLNLHIKNISTQKLLLGFEREGILLSTKSACSSGVSGPSLTLKAIGLSDHVASNSIRVSLGLSNTLEEVKHFIKFLSNLLEKL